MRLADTGGHLTQLLQGAKSPIPFLDTQLVTRLMWDIFLLASDENLVESR